MVVCSFKELQSIHSMLIEISIALQLKSAGTTVQPTQQKIITLIKQTLTKIHSQIVYNNLNFTGSGQQQTNMYEQIEKDLQKQQTINRQLIKKELQYKQYQKCLTDQLNQQKGTVKKLNNQLEKFSEKIISKDLQLAHLTNQKKILSKNTNLPVYFMLNSKLNLEQSKDLNEVKHTHSRRRSDEVSKRVSTANQKKKGSITKR